MKMNSACAMLAVVGLAAAASSASATTFLTDNLGTLVIDPTTETGSLSEATTLVYKNTTHPTSSALSYTFSEGMIVHSGTSSGIPRGPSDETQIDYTFSIATPVDLLYGQTINSVLGNKVALGGGTIQLLDLTTATALTPVVNLTPDTGGFSATTINYDVNLTDTGDLYALEVIGSVPVRPTSTSTINVQYSASVFATAVPEPTTWAMMILGVGGIGAAIRRRQAPVAA
jgi:hypothetical protein